MAKPLYPLPDEERCTQCGACGEACPEGCLGQDIEGFYRPDTDICTGCGLCVEACDRHALRMAPEPD
ncbi:MAG: 4Fe-4S binding protein [Desulfovibrionaceae bacterium]